MSVAAYKALFQLIVKPHYWEKTHHGLTEPADEDQMQFFDELPSAQAPADEKEESIAGNSLESMRIKHETKSL